MNSRGQDSEGRNRYVLVADDDPSFRAMLSRYLPKFGWRVLAVPDGLRALQLLELERVHAVVADERGMGGPSGALLLEAVHTAWPGTRLILYSGYPSNAAADRVKAIGGFVLTKGTDFGELRETLDAA